MSSAITTTLSFWPERIADAEHAAILCARTARTPQRTWASSPGVRVPPGDAASWLVADGRARQAGDDVLVDVARPAHECAPATPPLAAAEAYAFELVQQLRKYGVEARLVGLAAEAVAG